MKIHVDDFLKIGKQHKVCEDYIISGYDPIPYVVLSDGCSSSKNTEMGARLLCHLAKQYLKLRQDQLTIIDYDEMGNWVIHNAEMAARQLGLDRSSLDATLIVSYVVNESLYTFVYGDGSIITISDDEIMIYEISFTKNAPFYLSYLTDPERRELYRKLDNKKKLITYDFDGNGEVHHIFGLYSDPWAPIYGLKKYETIMVTSDGINSFLFSKIQESVDVRTIIDQFHRFKNVKGEFLKRRLASKRGAIARFEKADIFNMDDLSVGAFHITEDSK